MTNHLDPGRSVNDGESRGAGVGSASHDRIIDADAPLQRHPWPPVHHTDVPPELRAFLRLPTAEQRRHLEALREDRDEHGRFLHRSLSMIYATHYGYADSLVHGSRDGDLEIELSRAKIVLEDELFDGWLRIDPAPARSEVADQLELAATLRSLASSNDALHHPLFDYLAGRADEGATREFLLSEVVRNEVVDDEVALLTVGMQGAIKATCTLNHGDEVGVDERGRAHLTRFHTYWLRILLEKLDAWETLREFRARLAWHTGITSNDFNALLTRPGLKYAALGHFILTESWVAPHFEKVLDGLARNGLSDADVYFSKHALIDPHHTEELIYGIARQTPRLTASEAAAVLAGARIAIRGAAESYDRLLAHLRARHPRHEDVEPL